MVQSISNIFDKITDFESLYRSYNEASKGKRCKSEVLSFAENLEQNLFELSRDLREGVYEPQGFKQFKLFDPKERRISAPYFRDRIVHRSIHRELEPFFDRKFIHDSYACREGRGTHAGVNRAQEFMRKEDVNYFLKCDVRDYFGFVDHRILLERVDRYVGEDRLVDLIDTIISDYGSGKGLPIGTLYSQLFANVYLNGFDHFVKQSLGADYYVRYMDDFIFFSDSKQDLHYFRDTCKGYLRDELSLSLPYSKTTLEPVGKGATFLGYRIFPSYRLLRKRNKLGFKKRLERQKKEMENGEASFEELRQSLASWKGHAEHADTENLLRNYIGEI
ncbi:MAG: reverse transcriptase domain-containing protein [Candidatus Nanohalobium sp.]